MNNKLKIFTVIFLTVVLFAFTNLGFVADWGAAVNVSQTPTRSKLFGNWAKSLATDGAGFIVAVWQEVSSPQTHPVKSHIRFAQSYDGKNWGSTNLIPEVANLGAPKIAAFGPHIYVVWAMGAPYKVYLLHGVRNNGPNIQWDPQPTVVSNNSVTNARLPSISAFGNFVHVVWVDEDNGGSEVHYSRSIDFGARFIDHRQLSLDQNAPSWTPAISSYGTNVHVTWTDQGDSGACTPPDCSEELYYFRSLDAGKTWLDENRRALTCDSGVEYRTWAASVEAKGPNVHIAYFDNRLHDPSSLQFDIFHINSIDTGHSWPNCDPSGHTHVSNDYPANENVYSSWRPVLKIDDNDDVHITWWGELSQDQQSGPARIYYKVKSAGGWGGTEVLTDGTNYRSSHPSIIIKDGTTPGIIWEDQATSGAPEEILFKEKE